MAHSSSRLAVVGGGVAGLTFSLLAARAGREVVVIDRDPPRQCGDVESAWECWDRRSVPQFRQIHGYQALAHAVLQTRLPDVLGLLHQAGAREAIRTEAVPGADAVPGSDELVQFRCRRSTLESVLRAAVAREPGIEVREGTPASAVLTSSGTTRRVQGVRTTAGDVAADLVVDAAGRRSVAAAWCAEAGWPSSAQISVDTNQVYFTRWFRTCDPAHEVPYARIELSFATLLIYPADAGWLSATFFAPAGDAGLRSLLLDPDRFVAAARAIPPATDLLDPDLVEPHGDVLFMGRLRNSLRAVSPTSSVPGLVSLADAVMCTNPTWGRGVSLAMANAAALADLLPGSEDPAALSREFARIATAQLEPWYHDTIALDAEINALWTGATERSSRPISLLDALAAAHVDPVVHVAYSRYRNLLDPPSSFWDDEHIAARIRAAVAAGAASVVRAAPSRANLEAAAATASRRSP